MKKPFKKIYVFLFDGTFIEECVGCKDTAIKYNIKGNDCVLGSYIARKSIVYGKYFFNDKKEFNPKINKNEINNLSISNKRYSYGVNKEGNIYRNNFKIKDNLENFYFE